jgi:3-deoxy-D-manno-octulosonic-acid transferase
MAMGNPRFDVANNKSQGVDIKLSYDERIQKKLFLFASLWPEDHSILFPKIFDLLKDDESSKIVLVPHELSDSITNYYVDQIEKNNLSYKIIDAYMDMRNIEQNIIIVNTVGILYKLYWQAYIAYVGGGFSKNGIHNIMEPAVAGNPVIFGPNYSNSNFLEASQLLNKSAAFEVSSSEELMHRFNRLSDRNFYLSASDASKSVIDNNLGSTKKLISEILDE